MTSFSFPRFSLYCLMAIAVALYGCATSGGTSPTAVTGAAGGGASVGASDLERCDETLGTLAVNDGAGGVNARETMTVEPLLRLAVQQSNCFVITSVGNQRTDANMSRITQLQRDSGEYRAGSNQQKGQRVAADYYLEPTVVIKDSPTSGLGGALGGLIGNRTAAAASAAMESRSSVVTLSLYDIRSAIQLSISEGSSTSTNFGAALGAFGSKAGGTLGGYSKTPEGKATVAAFLDAYNKMVISLRNYKAQDVKGGMGTGGRLKVN